MGKKYIEQIPNSLLNLRFQAPQGRGLLQDDRAYKKILACKIWWVAVQYASSYGQNICYSFDVVCFCTYSWPYPSYLASPVLVNPSKVIFSIINYIQNIYCIAICAENIISDNIKNQENVCITFILSTCMYCMYVLHLFIT